MKKKCVKKAAFLDIDGTLHFGFSTSNSILILARKGVINKRLADDYNKILNFDPRRYTDYLNWCTDLDAMTLKIFTGYNKTEIKKALIDYRQEIEKNLFTFTVPLINLLQSNNFEIVLVTGSLDFVAEIFADIFEINYANVLASKLMEQNGCYITEFVPGTYMGPTDKKNAVLSLSHKYNLTKSIVVADAENDLEMFTLVGQAFLMKDENTPKTLIKTSKQFNAILVDKNLDTEKILNLFRNNFP